MALVGRLRDDKKPLLTHCVSKASIVRNKKSPNISHMIYWDFSLWGKGEGWHHASPLLNCLFALVQVIDALLHVFVFQVFFIGGVNAVEGPVRRQLDDPVTGGVEDLVVVGSHEDGALELN